MFMYNWFEKQFAKHRRKMQTGEGGFTLVELLVVIAILGILGGVGTVGYQGYAVKAREKADKEIIAVVNSAFASACLESRIDVPTVTEATVSVMEQAVHGLSTITATGADINAIAPAFDRYFEGNENSKFSTENVNSLVWNATEGTFEISANPTSLRITLSSGKIIEVSAEDMADILNSTYADMGYAGVKVALDNVAKSGGTLANICSLGTIPETSGGFFGIGGSPTGNYSGLLPKLTNAMKAFGLIDANKEREMLKNLCLADDLYGDQYKATTEQRNQSIIEAQNGLSMITAKYLASGGNVDDLIAVNLGNSSTGVIEPMATGTGGTKTVSAIAVQYALASSFANSEASEGVMIGEQTVSEYLATAEDPVAAINTVKNLEAYKNDYVGSEQYSNDKNGFVGTMSILGDNIGDINNPGNIDINSYLTNGLESNDAKEVLTGALGK